MRVRSDAADDAAIWVHPADASRSTIIGTNKRGGPRGRGLIVCDLSGREIQRTGTGNMNNVDLRYGFPLGGRTVALVTAGDRGRRRIAVYTVDEATRTLVPAPGRPLETGVRPYRSCMYRSLRRGKFYVLVSQEDGGEIQQWELFDDGTGAVGASKVRTIGDVASQAEGLVADDETARLYVAEEEVGVWEYGAEPTDSAAGRTLVDRTGAGGFLVADVEGLALADHGDGRGYLIASSQGEDRFVLYRREVLVPWDRVVAHLAARDPRPGGRHRVARAAGARGPTIRDRR